ncbi:MAG: CDP-glucose 4,6-dehydratase [Proteobacteria bacterium]|nr:CDP-glucose 4,6-dehydratase [Pseudomonadota bacterium]MBS0571646.1 CDP-glucose 4,6-dehydratase [Pseudomonadota bacterium]
MTPDFWRGRRVLVTGHTGFKGAWLCLWLTRLGARVTGLSLPPAGEPNLWTLLRLDSVRHLTGDVSDAGLVAGVLDRERPEIVLHLAAQSLVRPSYRDPVGTFRTNVMGVVVLLSAAARTPGVGSVVVVTSDKCYENLERDAPYAEEDRMGGRDPYSASKGCAELAAASMRASFFAPHAAGGHPARIATARAGNVIGGGDWSEDRLIPDIVRGCLGPAGEVVLRYPAATRPWQHVLESLRGYLALAEHLQAGTQGADSGWNFGPDRSDERSVAEVAAAMVQGLGRGRVVVDPAAPTLHEARILRLDSTKAGRIGWRRGLTFERTMRMTADWYMAWAAGADARALCAAQIDEYTHEVGTIDA